MRRNRILRNQGAAAVVLLYQTKLDEMFSLVLALLIMKIIICHNPLFAPFIPLLLNIITNVSQNSRQSLFLTLE